MRNAPFALAALLLVVALCGKAALAQVAQILGVGATMQNFGLRRVDPESGDLGTLHWLSDYVGPAAARPKRALVLSFYATWCEACVAELPELQRMQDEYGAQGLQMLGVNVRSKNEDVQSALSLTHKLILAHGVRYPLLFDRYTHRNQLLYLGDVARLPCNILIDHAGKIVARFQGGDDVQGLHALEAAIRSQVEQVLLPLLPPAGPGARP